VWDLIRLSMCLTLAFTAVGCGKVGDPLPPFIRIPEAASDLSVEQAAYELQFQWTNPLRNLDQSTASDLALAVLMADGEVVDEVAITSAGASGMYVLPSTELIGIERTYSVRFVTTGGRSSGLSNSVMRTVVPVPGSGPAPVASVDQGRVRLDWQPPVQDPELADLYRVYRSGVLISGASLDGPGLDDTTFVEGEQYDYRVVAVRRAGDRLIEGVPYRTLEMRAEDRTPPTSPEGVGISSGDPVAIIRWQESAETDFVRYGVYRRDGVAEEFVPIDDGEHTITAYFDDEYQPGYQYAVSAFDEAGNESPMSGSAIEE
jgi:hypothetical protein